MLLQAPIGPIRYIPFLHHQEEVWGKMYVTSNIAKTKSLRQEIGEEHEEGELNNNPST